ncbi:MAG TPA: helix-turn-helix domain-containing protein [Nitrososphaera sp.]|nr:helix-turn-helix domain-containing protein [Nitrososphaera sp.]
MSDTQQLTLSSNMGAIWGLLGRRWTLPILHALASADIRRFTELKKSLPDISGTMLSQRLQELEGQGLVTKHVYGVVPPKVEYALTASAGELLAIMRQVNAWRARWNEADGTRCHAPHAP